MVFRVNGFPLARRGVGPVLAGADPEDALAFRRTAAPASIGTGTGPDRS